MDVLLSISQPFIPFFFVRCKVPPCRVANGGQFKEVGWPRSTTPAYTIDPTLTIVIDSHCDQLQMPYPRRIESFVRFGVLPKSYLAEQ
jgi:hypothetical protein